MRLMASKPAQAFCFLALTLTLLTPADWAVAEPSEEQVAAIKANCRSDFMSKCWGVPRGGAEAMQCLKKNMASVSAPCQQALKAVTATAPAKAPGAAPVAAAKQESALATPAEPSPAAAAPTPSSETPAQGAEAKAAAPAEPAKSSAAAAPKEAAGSPSPASAQQAPKIVAPAAVSSTAPGAAAKTSVGVDTSSGQSSAEKPGAAPAASESMPPVIGFIPPRKKLMILRNCREDLDTYCPGVSYGEGRQLSCLESNRAALSPDCQGALAKLAR